MGFASGLLGLLLLGSLLGPVVTTRPELVSSSVWYTNQTILNVDYDIALVRMEFDQPLYTNGVSFLCSSADHGCDVPSCTACDWSGPQVLFLFCPVNSLTQ
jgi:hypothetical protein